MCEKKSCDISRCKASCCYNVPMQPAMFRVYKAHIQRPILNFVDQGLKDVDGNNIVTPITDTDFHKNKCPFLKSNCKCAIYDRRPWICRNFGTPPNGNTSKFLRCGWLEGKECDNDTENEQDVVDGMMDLINLFVTGRI